MADEAIVRIVLSDAAGGAASAPMPSGGEPFVLPTTEPVGRARPTPARAEVPTGFPTTAPPRDPFGPEYKSFPERMESLPPPKIVTEAEERKQALEAERAAKYSTDRKRNADLAEEKSRRESEEEAARVAKYAADRRRNADLAEEREERRAAAAADREERKERRRLDTEEREEKRRLAADERAERKRLREEAAEAEEDRKLLEIGERKERKWLEAAEREEKEGRRRLEREERREHDLARLEMEAHLEVERRRKKEAEEAERKRKREADAEFDPVREARKRRESEKRAEETRAAYERMYGGKKEPSDHPVFKLLDALRGTIGARFGPLVGGALDLWSALSEKGAPAAIPTAKLAKVTRADWKTAPPPPGRTPGSMGGGPPFAELAGEGAGMEGMAAMAGPIGAGIALALAAKGVLDNAVKAVVGGVGAFARGVADPGADPAVPLMSLGDAASKVGEKLPVVGTAAVIVGESLKELGGVMQAITQTAERYGQYSPQIAQSLAIADIRQTLGDFRRSKEVSGELSKYLIAQSDLQQKFEDIKIKVLVKMLPIVTRMLEVIEGIMPGAERIGDAVGALLTPADMMAKAMSELVGLKKDEKLPDVKDPTEQLMAVNGQDGFFMDQNNIPGPWTPAR